MRDLLCKESIPRPAMNTGPRLLGPRMC